MAERLVLVVMPDGMRVRVDDPEQLSGLPGNEGRVFGCVWVGKDAFGDRVIVNGRHVARCWFEEAPDG